MYLVLFSEKLTVISLHNDIQLVFVRETQCIFCEVDAYFLNNISMNARLQTSNITAPCWLSLRNWQFFSWPKCYCFRGRGGFYDPGNS